MVPYWVKVAKLASLELMFHVAVKDDIAWDHIETEMQKRGVALADDVHPLDLCEITVRGIERGQKKHTRSSWRLDGTSGWLLLSKC